MIYTLGDKRLQTEDENFYVAPGAHVIGTVRLGRGASVWFNCVLRGDGDWIVIGDGTNVQDGVVIHTDPGQRVEIGRNVTIGHMAFLHGCVVEDETLIGNGSIVLDRAHIGRNCVIAAGALVPPDKRIPDGSVVMGSPGKVVRSVNESDLTLIRRSALAYTEKIQHYRELLAIDARA